jgi:Mrp family chromosome partitioning ATPase
MDDWVSSAEQLLLFCRTRKKKSIAFVSPNAGSGVSTCAESVAGVAAQSGYRTVLIDISWTSASGAPGQEQSNPASSPMTSIVEQAIPFDRIKLKVDQASKYNFNNSEWMRDRIAGLLGNYDFALIDVPAILDRDTNAINPLSVLSECDCVLMVCEPGKIARGALQDCLDRTRLAGARVDGIVINDGRTPPLGKRIGRFLRIILGFWPSLGRWAEKRARNSTLFN